MSDSVTIFLIVSFILFVLGIFIRPIRKAMGLCIIIVGCLISMTGIGIILGLPMIFIGAIFLFV